MLPPICTARAPAFSKRLSRTVIRVLPPLAWMPVPPVIPAVCRKNELAITPSWQPTMSIAEPPPPQNVTEVFSTRNCCTPDSLMPSWLPVVPTLRTTSPLSVTWCDGVS